MKKRITAQQLQQMTTHEVADLLATIVEVLRSLPNQRWESITPSLQYAQRMATPAFCEQDGVRMDVFNFHPEGTVTAVYQEAVEVEFLFAGRRRRMLVPNTLPRHIHPQDIHEGRFQPCTTEPFQSGEYVSVHFDGGSFAGKVGDEVRDDGVSVRFWYNEQVKACLVHPALLTHLDSDGLPERITSL